MAPPSSEPVHPLAELATYMFTWREAMFTQWRLACEQDPALGKVSALSREEFNNLLPLILDSLEQRFLGKPSAVNPATTAQAHGLHRWHKSHTLIDTLNELNHLAQTLDNELTLFQELFPQFDKTPLLNAQKQISGFLRETIKGSVAKYDELQRLQATNRANTLQQALDQMQELSQQRGNMLRTSAHDLRGSFGIINSAAYLLNTEDLGAEERKQFMDVLNRNLISIQGMLTSLMDLSRLEAGQEQLQIESVDAAGLLKQIVENAQPMVRERGIVLWGNGSESLTVQTDPVKLQRVVQNLLINALKYTTSTPESPAIVSVSWSAEGDYRWAFSVQDSGPGLPATAVGALGQQLRPTVEPTSILGPDQSEPTAVLPDGVPPVPAPAELPPLPKGEGVGLQIVKRLCELLDANLDVETTAGRGTLFRVRMPIHHSQ